MKHPFMIMIVLATIIATDNGFAAEPAKHLFILSGQSNMAELDPNTSFTPTVENEFGQDNVIVVKDALGGAPIRRWYKGWESADGDGPEATGDLYDILMAKVFLAIQGQTIQTMTFVWMQGERDARERYGDVYLASLEGLIAQLRGDLGRQDINFVIGRLNDYGLVLIDFPEFTAHWTMVREAQVAVAEADLRGTWVDTDDLNGVENALHHTVEGYNILGKRFADKAIQLINSDGPLPSISYPSPGSTLTTTTVTFTGEHAGQAGEQHWLSIETSSFAKDIFHESLGTGHTVEVSNLPTSGTLYIRYHTYTPVAGWNYQAHTYTMNVGSTGGDGDGGGSDGGDGGGSDGGDHTDLSIDHTNLGIDHGGLDQKLDQILDRLQTP